MHLFFLITSLLGAAVVIGWRLREAKSPVTLRKIVIPPLGMSTGFAMFLYPPTHVPLAWALGAVALGATVFAYPLVRSSRLTLVGREVFVQRSAAFVYVLVGLVGVRLGLRSYVEQLVSPLQTGALFYLLAFGMVARWRVGMLREYRTLVAGLDSTPATA